MTLGDGESLITVLNKTKADSSIVLGGYTEGPTLDIIL